MFRWDHRLQRQNLFMSFGHVPRCFSRSAYDWLPTRKNYFIYAVANPARSLLYRGKKGEKNKSGCTPPLPNCIQMLLKVLYFTYSVPPLHVERCFFPQIIAYRYYNELLSVFGLKKNDIYSRKM